MKLLRKIAWTALAAGIPAGLFLSALQTVWVTPLLLQAERYEATAEALSGWSPEWAVVLERSGYAIPGNLLTGVGFGLLLAAGLALRGREAKPVQGLLWGLAGYAAFVLTPALGIPPSPPGATQAPLIFRQLWWVGSSASAGAGLALLAFSPRLWKILGILLVLLPHLIGAPDSPPSRMAVSSEDMLDLSTRFAGAVLITAALFWAAMGGISGWMWRKLSPPDS